MRIKPKFKVEDKVFIRNAHLLLDDKEYYFVELETTVFKVEWAKAWDTFSSEKNQWFYHLDTGIPSHKEEEADDGYCYSVITGEDLIFSFSMNSEELVKNISHPLPKI